MINAKCKMAVAFREAKSKFIKLVCANIGALGVPSSPSAEGASPRRSLELVCAIILFLQKISFNSSILSSWQKVKSIKIFNFCRLIYF